MTPKLNTVDNAMQTLFNACGPQTVVQLANEVYNQVNGIDGFAEAKRLVIDVINSSVTWKLESKVDNLTYYEFDQRTNEVKKRIVNYTNVNTWYNLLVLTHDNQRFIVGTPANEYTKLAEYLKTADMDSSDTKRKLTRNGLWCYRITTDGQTTRHCGDVGDSMGAPNVARFEKL